MKISNLHFSYILRVRLDLSLLLHTLGGTKGKGYKNYRLEQIMSEIVCMQDDALIIYTYSDTPLFSSLHGRYQLGIFPFFLSPCCFIAAACDGCMTVLSLSLSTAS